MAKISLLCFIVVEILLIQAMASLATATTDRPLSLAPEPSEIGNGEGSESEVAEPPGIRRLGKHHGDKSVAGGGVIIGGLVTAIFAAVFCYIRVTRKKDGVNAVH